MDTVGLRQRFLVSGSDDYNTQLLYFTCSSLSADDRYIYLLSDRTIKVYCVDCGKTDRIVGEEQKGGRTI